MTEISKHHTEQFYDGDRRAFDIGVDIEATANRTDNEQDALEAVQRIREAVRKGAQAIRDEMGEADGDG